jgi:parvulin-like peptidyl-prolyl isomerase
MKSFLLFLITGAVWAQTATPPSAPPPSTDLGPDTVVASFGNGQNLTIGELKTFLAAMPPNMQQSAQRDRRAFVTQFALMHRLAELAEAAKLDQRTPTRESLAFNRLNVLMNAQLHEVLDGIQVPPADAQAFYDQNKTRFSQVKVKAIYIPFSGTAAGADAPKHLSEAEAEAKITKLRTSIAAGADFVKMVKENSEDQTSAAKDGDFGTIRRTDNLPEAIRNAIFKLKAGEVSEPVKQPNGFYLFRAEEISAQPFNEVQDEIVNELKQTRFREYMDQTTRSLNLKIENEAFFSEGAPAGPTAGR